MLVWLLTSSSTTSRRAPAASSSASGCGRRAIEARAPRCTRVAGDRLEQVEVGEVDRRVDRVDDVGHRRQPLLLEQHRAHPVARVEGAPDDLVPLGDEQPLGRLPARPQRHVGEAHVVGQHRVVTAVTRRTVPIAAAHQSPTSTTIATTPTRTTSPRSTGAGTRRPILAPTWPPTTAPSAIRPAASQAMSVTG